MLHEFQYLILSYIYGDDIGRKALLLTFFFFDFHLLTLENKLQINRTYFVKEEGCPCFSSSILAKCHFLSNPTTFFNQVPSQMSPGLSELQTGHMILEYISFSLQSVYMSMVMQLHPKGLCPIYSVVLDLINKWAMIYDRGGFNDSK